MDICNALKCITNLNEYISATQDILNKCPDPKIKFNMSTVLAMKRIRSYEIEYFNKCDENGAAFIVFEQILCLPPSKTWGLLGVELISLVQYWLEALRKHLIFHNNHWWQFLNALLSFIEKIRQKSTSIRNVLVQETAECLLDLATNDKPDISQRYKIIHCFNLCCADCSREIRISMRDKFTSYFTRLAHLMAGCGDARTQLGGLEALLRWLLPRQDEQLRRSAAADWFPPRLYPARCRDIFLERRWQNFAQDARDFLNAHNEGGERVLSIVCSRLAVGGVVLVSEQDEKEHWLDINTGSRSISLVLESKQLEVLDSSSSDVLLIEEDNVEKLHLQGAGDSCVLQAWVVDARQLHPSKVLERARHVTAALARPAAVRRALAAAFPSTHVIVTDINSPNKNIEKPQYSNIDAKEQTEAATDARRTSRSGYIVRPRVPVSWQSPSTASTSSLAMLRDKLSALSGFIFDKEPVSVCAVPQLSNVTELSESEEQKQFNSLSTIKLRPYGVCTKNRNNTESKRDKSDESVETVRKCISPVFEDEESSVSCLLVATIGSANDSVINDTLDRLPKDKDIHTDNIVDLLAKEALQYKQTSEVANEASEAYIRDKNVLDEIPCDPNATNIVEITKKDKKKPPFRRKQTVLSNTTTDDSNNDYVEDTPVYSSNKKKKATNNNLDDSNKDNFDSLIGINRNFNNQDFDTFFSQHINENCNRELVISPTLAQKINRSSSESGSEFDLLPHIIDNNFNINDIEIIECLNEMVDKVCKDLEKYSEYLGQDLNVVEQLNEEAETSKHSSAKNNTNLNKMNETDKDNTFPRQHPTSMKSFKLKFNTKNTKVTRNKTQNKRKMELEPIVETSQIMESDNMIDNELDIDHNSPKTSNKPDEFKTPLLRRRRKLYSPKDDHATNKEVPEITDLGSNEKITEESKPQQTTSTPYKEIEKMRKNRILRNKSRKTESSLSPRSKKLNDMFDNLKNTIEGEKNIVLAKRNTRNRGAIYNFPSDSEDEDFKEIPKKSNKRTTNNSTVKPSGRRKLHKVEKPAPVSKKRNNKRNARRSTNKYSEDLEKPQMRFEQMRNAPPEALEVSFVAEMHKELENDDPGPVIAVVPTMEAECNEELNENVAKQRKKNNVRTEKHSKDTTNKLTIIQDKSDDKDITVSPLPGLVIETMPLKNNKKDSISTCMLDGLNDISDVKNMSLLNNTQNLLSYIEQVHNLDVYNIDDEVSVAASNDSKIKRNKYNLSTRKNKKSQRIKEINKRNSRSSQTQSKNNVHLTSDSEKSIVTAGKSPITAHGDFNEAPPSFRQLSQRITEQRGLEVNDVNDTLQEYFKNLNNDINISSNKSISSTNSKDMKGKPKKDTTVSNLYPAVTITRLSLGDINKWIPPRYNSVFGSDQSSNDSVTTKRKASTNISIHKEKSVDVKRNKNADNNEKLRLSAISPIKLFDEFQNDRPEYSSPKRSIKSRDYKNVQRNSEASSCRYELRSNRNFNVNNKSNSKNSVTSVDESEVLRVPSVKRKSSANTGSTKRRKVSDTVPSVVQSDSVPSASSVEVWMAENVVKQTPTTISENVDLSLKDSIEIVLEKLDTTLLEIHHNTSKKFVNMFLGVQKRLADKKEERQRMYRAGVRELLAEIVKLIDHKFLELDHRSQEMDDEFMSSLREQARGLLRDDCRQKRTMVELLRQDVQAARDHYGRTGH